MHNSKKSKVEENNNEHLESRLKSTTKIQAPKPRKYNILMQESIKPHTDSCCIQTKMYTDSVPSLIHKIVTDQPSINDGDRMRVNSSDDVHAEKKSQTGINQTTKGKIYTALNKPKIKARS